MNNQLLVLLPYYNNLKGLRLTLKSLLKETEVFKLLIYDDGSDDKEAVLDLISNYKEDFEIIYKRNEFNLGITKTLNKALKYILGLNKFYLIARLDAGDICLNDRFKHQKQLLDTDSDVCLVGSWVRFVNMKREPLFVFKPSSCHNKLKNNIYLYNPFIHPSIMFKTEIINKIGFYPDYYPALEDHAYFFKIIKHCKTKIIEKVLLEYEVNPNSISISRRSVQTKSRVKLLLFEYRIGWYPTLGLIRAIITFLLPHKLLTFIKKQLVYKK